MPVPYVYQERWLVSFFRKAIGLPKTLGTATKSHILSTDLDQLPPTDVGHSGPLSATMSL